MRPTLHTAKRFQELLELSEPDGPYFYSSIFDDSNWRARRRSRQKPKLLRRIDGAVRSIMEEGEAVRFVTTGSAVSFWESYFLGWIIYYLNRRAFVLTDRRIILIQIDSRSRPKVLRSQLRYSAITEVRRSFVSGTVVRLRNGKSRSFSGVPRADRRFLTDLVARVKHIAGDGFDARAIEELCPHCYAVVPDRPTACSACGGRLKSARRAGLLSLLWPGFGDFYIGHRTLAVFEIFFVALLWLVTLWPDPEYSYTPVGYLIIAGFLVLFLHVPDAVGTWYIARMGVYPGSSR